MSDCLFCKIIKGEIPSDKVYEDDYVFVFKDIQPTAPYHFLAVPKIHIETLDDITEENSIYISKIYEVISKLSKEYDFKDGYRVVTNCKEAAGQTVFHIHFHILAGRKFEWPAG